ncbi:excisionase family DNA-binding protein [Lacipirellula limnantheis]|uniref:Helix-turn-helix domain protein n=1 Tax=Lacipirellula limnantheis TaxID=2528024 RepID=A0A517TVS6_9BACT|nr:excisionase family DNA-binding protein [Lacipirellula limnantheis]QDT72470.1 Helix-turn-helix domain protein [Lacipirellula limnantheis]
MPPLRSDDILDPILMTREETAKLLRCSRRFVDGLLANGVLPKVKLGTKSLIRRDDVMAYIAGCVGGES